LLTVILATGGTGGHIFPALAVANKLKDLFKENIKIVFIGGRYGQEKRLFPMDEYECFLLPVKGIAGKGIKTIINSFLVLYSMITCYKILRKLKPDIVVGFGSYASFVPVYLATKMNIPTCIHEQNSYPGITNRILGKRVDKIFLSFPDEFGIFDMSKTEVVGNPVREEILNAAKEDHSHIDGGNKKINLLVVGGSQGAKAINDGVLSSLPILKKMGVKIHHQTGEIDFSRVLKGYNDNKMQGCIVEPFIKDMASAYKWADLVVCRAGASTIFELAVMGKPSILIPYPYAAKDHQKVNASYLERAGGALVLEQSMLETKSLGNIVADVVSIPGKLKDMARGARSVAKPRATDDLVNGILKLVRQKKEIAYEKD